MRRKGTLVAIIAALATSFGATEANAQEARQLFGGVAQPSQGGPQVYGGYARGCLAGALALARTGPGLRWQAMRLSRNRNFGHPNLVAFIERLSTRAQAFGWGSVLVGDMAQPRGGPMLTGHRSHQTGIDVDIWMRPGPAGRELTAQEREEWSSTSVLSADRRDVNEHWTPLHPLILNAAATDPEVARIFVNAAIKGRLCRDLQRVGAPTDWLRNIRPWFGHHYHFHVRLRCPDDSPGCVNQDPPPPGDGCDEVGQWLTDTALNPPPRTGPPPAPRRELTLDDLPPACRGLVRR